MIIPPAVLFAATLSSASAFAGEDAEFDVSFMPRRDGKAIIDVSRFTHGNPITAGRYNVDLWLNGVWKGRTDVQFLDNKKQGKVELCFTPVLSELLDLKSEAMKEKTSSNDCISFRSAVPAAHVRFDMSTLRLEVEIAQALVITRPRGWISPSSWDKGVSAAFVGYDINNYRYHTSNNDSNQTWLGLRVGFNIGGWAFRHRGSRSYGNTSNDGYNSIETALHHDIPMLHSQLTLGEFNTDGTLMESINLRGVRLSSDERMLPGSQRGYAPVVRGIAASNARVVIRQNGNVLYETTVPPGPFSISDIYPTGYGSDLNVTVTESSGQTRSFTVPFASVAQLVRPGYLRYQLSAGRYNYEGAAQSDIVSQSTLQYGLSNDLTLNSGVIFAPHYTSGLTGLAFNTSIGAIASDVTIAQSKLTHTGETKFGYSFHSSYSARIPGLDTNISLAAYRYSSSDFFSLKDTMQANSYTSARTGTLQYISARPKNQLQLSINQDLGQKYGSLFLAGSSYRYWDKPGSHSEYQAGYTNFLGRISYQLGYSRSKDHGTDRTDDRVYLNFSMPLSDTFRNTLVSATMSHSRNANNMQTMVSGVSGDDNQFNWGVSGNTQSHGETGWTLNTGYRTPFVQTSATAGSDSAKNRQMSLGISGALVAHPYGLTLSNDLSDTFTIIHAPGARGARINNSVGHKLDYWGNGIVPHVIPYEKNPISIDPEMLPTDVELSATEQEVIPRANSSTLVSFTTKTGDLILFDIRLNNGDTVPMGAEAIDENKQPIGWVAQGGRLFTRGLSDKGRIQIVWGKSEQERCAFNYSVVPQSHADKTLPLMQTVRCGGG